jgi:hypothetical protein
MKPHFKPLPILVLIASLTSLGTEASASALARCAAPGGAEAKIAACAEASRSTPYPWILHWVHRELARAQRELRDPQGALASYARALAAAERENVRREMEELSAPFTQ